MTQPGGWDDLDAVLDTFEERREKEEEARRSAQAKEKAFRETCVALLEDVVVPAFEAAGRTLAKRAHECTVSKRIADYDIPSVELGIRPYVPHEDWVRRSRLSMRCVCTEGFVVFGEVCPPRKEPTNMQVTFPLADVTETLIKEQVIRFVRAVLNEY